jgi:hypothetical protein
VETLDIEKFSPKEAELRLLAESCKTLDITDIKAVRETRIRLKNSRVEITKQGKAMRDDANKFASAVIAREKELVAIIEPEERRLQEIETEAEAKLERERRVATLPARRERLDAIGDNVGCPDHAILDMDDAQFNAYCNGRIATKNEQDRLSIEAEKARVQAETEALEREKQAREREEAARQEAQAEAERKLKAEREAYEFRIKQEQAEADRRVQAEKERVEREAKEKVELEAKQKAEAERVAAEAKAKQEADARYQTWLKEINYVEGEFYLSHSTMGHIVAYKLVSTFKK